MDPAAPARRAAGDRGATLLEGALVAPLFLLLLFGVFEFGLVFHNELTVKNAVASSARAGSTYGNDPDADFKIIQAVEDGMQTIPASSIERVVVFNATQAATNQGVSPAQASVPASCLTGGGVEGLCNVYIPSNVFDEDDPREINGDIISECADNDKPGEYWCPMTRQQSLNPAPGPHYLGIHIEFEHEYVTGFFGDTLGLSATKIVRLEPQSLNVTP